VNQYPTLGKPAVTTYDRPLLVPWLKKNPKFYYYIFTDNYNS
jgi:hypothetical protein